MLYLQEEREDGERCAQSVLEIRRTLTEVIGAGHIGSELADSLRAMRRAARRFLDGSCKRNDDDSEFVLLPTDFGVPHGIDIRFNQALGQLRATFGFHIAAIAVRYGIDVEDELAEIMPPPPD